MLSEKEYQERTRTRVIQLIETDAIRYFLESVARSDLFHTRKVITNPITLEDALTFEAVVDLDELAPFPLRMEYRHRESCMPELGVRRLLNQHPDTEIAKVARTPRTWQNSGEHDRGVSLVVPWGEEMVILHDCPFFTKSIPLDRLKTSDDSEVVMHYYKPFISELAERWRGYIASEEQIIELEEGEWWPARWEDFEPSLFE